VIDASSRKTETGKRILSSFIDFSPYFSFKAVAAKPAGRRPPGQVKQDLRYR
jgi:hypothetical protein